MLKNTHTHSKALLTTLILAVILFNACSNVLAASSTYQLPLTKITKFNEVVTYDKDAWKETISTKNEPDDWFEGDADKIRAQIADMGIELIDHKSRTTWMKKEKIKSDR